MHFYYLVNAPQHTIITECMHDMCDSIPFEVFEKQNHPPPLPLCAVKEKEPSFFGLMKSLKQCQDIKIRFFAIKIIDSGNKTPPQTTIISIS